MEEETNEKEGERGNKRRRKNGEPEGEGRRN